MWMRRAALVCSLLTVGAWSPEMRSFPTGDGGSSVKYVDTAGLGHPSACVVAVTAGLPAIALAFNTFSNGKLTITVASQVPFPPRQVDTDAGVRVGSAFVFGKVTSYQVNGAFHTLTLDVVDTAPGTGIADTYKAINSLTYGPVLVAVVADDAPVGSAKVPAQPGIGDALSACQKYMTAHFHS